MTLVKPPAEPVSWYSTSAEAAAERLGVSPERGLDAAEVTRRLAEYGPNELATEPPPSRWEVARGQLSNPMNIMLLIVCVASFAIGQVATALVVLGLVTFNVVMGSNQELKARASVEALAQLQVPARPGAAIRPGRGDRVDEAGARGRRAARGGRRRTGGRPDPHFRVARGAGSRAHRRERAGEQGPHDPSRG